MSRSEMWQLFCHGVSTGTLLCQETSTGTFFMSGSNYYHFFFSVMKQWHLLLCQEVMNGTFLNQKALVIEQYYQVVDTSDCNYTFN